jgi:hypothetical protein
MQKKGHLKMLRFETALKLKNAFSLWDAVHGSGMIIVKSQVMDM